MTKKIFQEILIYLLILVLIALILGIIFYQYVPKNKTIPVKVKEYAMEEDVQKELKETVLEDQKIVKTFFIGSKDLNVYEATKDYDKGKANPFADYGKRNENGNENDNNGSNKVDNSNKHKEDYGYKKGKQ